MKLLRVFLAMTMLLSAATCWGQDESQVAPPANLEESPFFLSNDALELNRIFKSQVYQANKRHSQAKTAPLIAELKAVRDYREELNTALALTEEDYTEACQEFADRIEKLEGVEQRGRLPADFKKKKTMLEARRQELESSLAAALDQEARLSRAVDAALYVPEVTVSLMRPLVIPGLDMTVEKLPEEPGLSPDETAALLAEALDVAKAKGQKGRAQGEKE